MNFLRRGQAEQPAEDFMRRGPVFSEQRIELGIAHVRKPVMIPNRITDPVGLLVNFMLEIIGLQ